MEGRRRRERTATNRVKAGLIVPQSYFPCQLGFNKPKQIVSPQMHDHLSFPGEEIGLFELHGRRVLDFN